MSRFRPAATLIFTGLLIPSCQAAGQTTQPPSAQSASAPAANPAAPSTLLHANVNLVLVEVLVTDHDKPVHGLERNRFHVFEDGHEQAVASFDEHQPPAADTAGSIPMMKPAALPPHTYTNLPEYPDAGAVNVLLLDGLNTPLNDQMNVRLKMIGYLGKIKPGTSLAIFGLSSQLRMIASFSTDLAALTRALKSPRTTAQQSTMLDSNKMAQEGGVTPSSGGSVNGSQSTALAGVTPPDEISTEMNAAVAAQRFQAETISFQTDQRVRMTLEAFQQLARYLSSIPGRKNVIWFSGSFPIVIAPEDPSGQTPSASVRGYMGQLRNTTEMLADARVSIYPVDARGLMAPSQFNAANTTSPASDNSYLPHTNSTPFAEQGRLERVQTAQEQATMQQIAQDTGGKAFINTNDFADAVAEIIENGSSYYTIGYVPDRKQFDGKFHTFKVRIDNASYSLVYRRGYYADAPDKPFPGAGGQANPMAAAALQGAPPASQVIFKAQVLPITDPLLQGVNVPGGPAGEMSATLKGPAERYVVKLTLNPDTLSLDTTPDGIRHGKIELALVVYDDGGNRVNYVDHPFQLAIKPELYQRVAATGITIVVPIDLPAGEKSLRIAVNDLDAGRTGSLEVPIAAAAK